MKIKSLKNSNEINTDNKWSNFSSINKPVIPNKNEIKKYLVCKSSLTALFAAKVELFLEIFGNLKIREQTKQFLQKKTQELIRWNFYLCCYT